ncbi:MAG: ribonuclease H-like domain-containing protein [Candidatus Pacearchaeota archaeon]|nr:ribonuclease H-like domain-containing protein [Candidatus Pacearchaeota archaeon]
MEIKFIPIDYDSFDWQGRNYIRIIGRDEKGKRVAVLDSFEPYLWAILKEGISEKKIKELQGKIEKIKVNEADRVTKVEKTEVHKKHFLGKEVTAIKIFITNYKDAHPIADKLDFPEIEARREYDLSLITKYIIEKNVVPFSWFKVSGEILNNSEEFGSIDQNLEVDLCIKAENIIKIESSKTEKEEYSPKVLAFDIETDEFEIGRGEILMISLVGKNYEKVLTWKKCPNMPKFVECFKDEAEMLEKFIEYVKKFSPDMLVGYYSDNFDLPYLRARAEKNRMKLDLGLDGRQPMFARGKYPSARVPGIVHIDLFRFIETAYSQYLQSETLGLNEVASEFLGEGKKEFNHKHSSKINHDEWVTYFEYNLQDSVITYKLAEKIMPDMIEFSKIIQEPIFEVTRNGMSQQVEHYILHNLKRYDEIAEKRPIHDEIEIRRQREKYEGAFVFQPTPGLYEDIAMFDFTSMHASIIVSFNISKATLLEKKQPNSYESPEFDLSGSKVQYYFSKKPGFFPLLLGEIVELRKKFKKELKEKPDVIKKARSNAYKLLANAYYGYLGFFGARYYSIEAAASTLAFVRKFNKEVIEKVNKEGYKVIMADSVDGNTRVFVKRGTSVYEENIKDLFKKVDNVGDDGKEYNLLEGTDILTLDKGGNSIFQPIKHVMRHKCNKKMYRVHFTNNWHIDVTEDHSLLGYQSNKFNQSRFNRENPLNRIIEVKPVDIGNKVKTIISLKKIPLVHKTKNYPNEVYEMIGYFIGDGSFNRDKKRKKYNKDYSIRLSLGNDADEILKNLIEPLIKLGMIKNYWFSKSRKGDMTFTGLKLVRIISENCRDQNGKKQIPNWLFEEKEENIASFLRGLFSADGCVMIRGGAPIIKVTSINDKYIEQIRKLLYRIGISHSVFKENTQNKYKTKNKIYCSGSYSKNIIIKDKETFCEKVGFLLERKNRRAKIITYGLQKKLIKKFEFETQSVKNVEEIKIPEYVYDIEVDETHRFFANNVLVHNTDSVGFALNNKSKKQVLDFLKNLNDELPGIMELELEDFYKRGIWVTKRTGEFGAKKKYALLSYNGKMKIRGFETVRRDWCKLARELQDNILDMILKDGNADHSLALVQKTIDEIKKRKIDKEKLMIKTQLKKPIEEYLTISPHVTIAKKMVDRGSPVDVGMLIKFYISEPSSNKKGPIRDRAKLPDEEGEYDIAYYLDHQIIPAVENIFQVFSISKEDILGKKQMKLGEF